MATLQVIKGFMDSRASRLPASGPDTEWPGLRATDEQRRAFRAALIAATLAKGLDPHTLAKQLFGEYRDRKTKSSTARNGSSVYSWLRGESYPTLNTVNGLAQFFGKTVEYFLQYDGPLQHIEIRGAGGKKKGNGNGHAGPPVIATPSKVKPEPPAPRPLPPSAKPIGMEFKTLPGEPDFAEITISGTASLDVCLGLIAFIERHRSPRE
jgi:transcriptional regulator with XRE-family HTH domain